MQDVIARPPMVGGIAWGISLARYEGTNIDWWHGRITKANLENHYVPLNAKIGQIDASPIDIPDYQFDSLGARGVGEIAMRFSCYREAQRATSAVCIAVITF